MTDIEKKLDSLFDEIYTVIGNLRVTAYVTREPVRFENRFDGEKKQINTGDRWGELWDCAWMHIEGEVPTDAKNAVLLLDVGGEGCVFGTDGLPKKGITNKKSEFTIALGKPAKRVFELNGEKTVDLWIDAAANDLFGAKADSGVMVQADIAERNEEKRGLFYDLEVVAYAAANLTGDEKVFAEDVFERAFLQKDNTQKAREIALEYLSKQSENKLFVTAIGHAHIDLAWLWPIRETKRKAARTVATLLENMSEYPDYIFGISQPQMLVWIKDEYPSLYEGLKKLYKAGRLELQGGFWVESDTNLPCGESLVRQVIYGKRFWREEFGFEQKLMWIPDVFGYNAQLPQIMKKSGLDYFLTIKLSWNEINKFPYSSFVWRGLDGSRVLAHMPPEGNYNSASRPDSLAFTQNNFREKDICDEAMLLFGIGDGGGGPGKEHLERLSREKSLCGFPKTRQGKALDFFERLEAKKSALPEYRGELYLEKHQGTYTTAAQNKKFNRMCEKALHNCELIAAVSDEKFDKPAFDELYREVLLYQFHDIIPGSCIARVYKETDKAYSRILADISSMTKKAAEGFEGGGILYNTLPFERTDYVKTENGYQRFSALPFCAAKAEKPLENGVVIDGNALKNDKIRVEFAKDGSICSVALFNTEMLASKANLLTLFEDNENAWETPTVHKPLENALLQSFSISVTDGVGEAKAEYTIGCSHIDTVTLVYPDSERIDIFYKIEWNETKKMLRTAFPVAVNSDFAECGIQFGSVLRPTHTNTTLDRAKKEVCAQKWLDISQRDRGASVLSGYKYGYRVWGNVIDVSLLRSSMFPALDCDKGVHEFSLSFYPHLGDRVSAEVVKQAYIADFPLLELEHGANSRLLQSSMFCCDGSLVLESVKPSEDKSGIVLRLYECDGGGGRANLQISPLLNIKRAFLTDLEENPLTELKIDDKCKLDYSPYEIITVLLKK